MNIGTILSLFLYAVIKVDSINWTTKDGNNGIALVHHSSALISFTTHTQEYEIDLEKLWKITENINKHITTIENSCLESNDEFRKEMKNKLSTHAISITEKIISISDLEQNCQGRRTKRDFNFKEAAKEVLDRVDSFVNKIDDIKRENNLTYSKMNNNFNIQVCTLEMMDYEKKIFNIQNFLIKNDANSLFKIIDVSKVRKDIFENSIQNKSIKSFSKEGTCGDFLETNKLISKLLKNSEISSQIVNSEVIIKMKTPIFETSTVKIHKIIKTPVTVYNETLIIEGLAEYVIVGAMLH